MTSTRTPLITGLAGLMTAGYMFSAGTAAAQPNGGLLDTTCSFTQVRAAVQEHNPELAANAERMGRIEQLLSLPVEERQAKAQQIREHKSSDRTRSSDWKSSPEGQARIAAMQNVFDTCNQY